MQAYILLALHSTNDHPGQRHGGVSKTGWNDGPSGQYRCIGEERGRLQTSASI